MVLGGTGQGLPTDKDPATAYLGPGPWGSLGPAMPSIPSQALKGLATLIVVVAIVLLASRIRPLRRPDGRLFLLALASWAIGRAIVSSTWRDPVVLGPLRAEQAIDAVVAIGSIALALVKIVIHRGRPSDDPASAAGFDGALHDPDLRRGSRTVARPARRGRPPLR